MNVSTVPKLSKENIKNKVQFFIKKCGSSLYQNQYCDIDLLLNELKKQEGLHYIETTLGKHEQAKILGVMISEKKTIAIDMFLNQYPEVKRFTQAHEIAHWVLHRDCYFPDYSLADTQERLTMARSLVTTYDWVEWHANTFAMHLLISEPIFRRVYQSAKTLLHIDAPLKDVVPKDYHRLLTFLSHTFMVSRTVMGIYIKQLAQLL